MIFSLALAANVVADVFLVLMPSEKNLLVGVCIMAGVQALYLLYTLFLIKSNGWRVISLALRVGLCLLAYFLLPQYFVLTTVQMIYAMIVINAFVTLLTFVFFLKTQWLTFLGFLLFFVSSFASALVAGWAIIFKFPLDFLQILVNPFLSVPGLGYIFYVPGVLLLALSSVWELGKEKHAAKVAKVATPAQPEKTQTQEKLPQSKEAAVTRATTTEGMNTISLDDL